MKTQTDQTYLRNCIYFYIYCYISLCNVLHVWHLSGRALKELNRPTGYSIHFTKGIPHPNTHIDPLRT
jgi:hypothetical protein